MQLTFNEKIFNPLYKLLRNYSDDPRRFTILRGGAGSGKSYSLTQFIITECLSKKQKWLVVRKVAAYINASVVDVFINILYNWNLTEYYNYNKTERVLTFSNGSIIIFKGMDDPAKLKSISNIDHIWCEEADELDSEDFEQLNLRARGKDKHKIYLSFNPVSKDNWLFKRFYKEYDRDNVLYTHSTYLHNKFVGKDYHKQMEFYKKYDFNYYKIYALGEWGNLNTGGEFYKMKDSIIRDSKYDPSKVLHLSFDENVVPYISCIVSQVNNKRINIIKEYAIEDPFNNIYDLCNYIKEDFKNHQSGMIIYGDSTSRKRDTKLENGVNFFSLIVKELDKFKPTERVPKSNPPVKTRGEFINQIIHTQRDGINLLIDPDCVKLIDDLQNVKTDSDGTKFKQKVTDKKTGIRYEKYGHLSDCLDYLICEMFNVEFDTFKNGGKVNIQIPTTINPINMKVTGYNRRW